MNPFRINYKKSEDKVTYLLVHVLEHCQLITDFLRLINWKQPFKPIEMNQHFTANLQLHNDFTLPVKHAYILGISNTGQIIDDALPAKEDEGHPDAYFYDEENQVLILVEVKVGNGTLYSSQITNHKSKVSHILEQSWIHSEIAWEEIKIFLKSKLQSEQRVMNYQPI
ncbi:hypothetical protein ACFCP7_24540 [Paenibacillus elgii]